MNVAKIVENISKENCNIKLVKIKLKNHMIGIYTIFDDTLC